MNVIKYKNIFIVISFIAVAASVVSIAYFGFNLGIDFTSGSLWQIKVLGSNPAEIRSFFYSELETELSSVSYDKDNEIYTISFAEITDETRQNMFSVIKEKFGDDVEDLDFWTISPTVSKELTRKAILAIGFVLLAISLYIAFAFRKISKPISSWKYGFITLITLMHDVAIPAGLFAYLGYQFGASVDTNFIVALLVVMGFSVHDTIVVFDRVKENLTKTLGKKSLGDIINTSIKETIHRSINTSATLILVLITLFFFGPSSLQFFILTILVGTIIGTYSSIFLASPMLTFLEGKHKS
ncbi:MAG TPA: protein translocase subunit SecF [Candidatus Paceibacterota bacterium]